jgi:hypothetical protein
VEGDGNSHSNVVIEVFEVIRENKRESKDTWWWNEDVQKTINEKNAANIYITTEVMKIYSTKKSKEMQRKLWVKQATKHMRSYIRKLDTNEQSSC